MHTLHKTVALLTVLLFSGGLLYAQNGQGYYPDPPAPTTVWPSECPPVMTSTVGVSLTEYSIALDQGTIPVGNVMFYITNKGIIPHSFAIRGPGLNTALANFVQPGQEFAVSFPALQRGHYMIYDPIQDYVDLGMRSLLIVSQVSVKGCGCGSAETTASAGVRPPRIQVSLTDNSLTLNRIQIPSGTVAFVIVNNGHHRHSFAISGPSFNVVLPHTLRPGASMVFTVQGLRRGSYRLYDPMHNYANAGLQTTLTISRQSVRRAS